MCLTKKALMNNRDNLSEKKGGPVDGYSSSGRRECVVIKWDEIYNCKTRTVVLILWMLSISLSLSLSQIGLRNNQGMHTDVDSHNNVPGHKLVDQGFFF